MDSIENIFQNTSFDDKNKSSLNYAYEFMFSKSTSQCFQLKDQLITVVHFSMSVNYALAIQLNNHTK